MNIIVTNGGYAACTRLAGARHALVSDNVAL